MSWSDYVSNMTAKGAALCGVYTQQGAVCAQSSGLSISPAEIVYLKSAVEGGDNTKISIGGQPATLIQIDKDDCSLMAKTKNACLNDSKVFYHVELSKLYMIVVGMSGPGERNACNICHNISSYLKTLDQ